MARRRRPRSSPPCSTPGGLDPTVINGGIINAYGTNARLGAGDWMVVEADESDGTFLKLPADVAVVTNIDPEHLDHFHTFDAIKDAFLTFIENLPFYGFAVMCLDHPTVQELVGRIEDRRVITYGENPQADVRLLDVDLDRGRQPLQRAAARPQDRSGDLPRKSRAADAGPSQRAERHGGDHGRLSARLADQVFARRWRASAASSGASPRPANGTACRSSTTMATIPSRSPPCCKRRARLDKGKVVAVMQPHRFTRLQSLFDEFATCFNDADSVIIADVYPAGEQKIEGVDRDALVAAIKAHGHRHALGLPSPEVLRGMIRAIAEPGDYVVFLGAGNITQWAYALPGELAASRGPERVMRFPTSARI